MIELDASRILGGMVGAGGVVAAGTKQVGVKVLPQAQQTPAAPASIVQAATTPAVPATPTLVTTVRPA